MFCLCDDDAEPNPPSSIEIDRFQTCSPEDNHISASLVVLVPVTYITTRSITNVREEAAHILTYAEHLLNAPILVRNSFTSHVDSHLRCYRRGLLP